MTLSLGRIIVLITSQNRELNRCDAKAKSGNVKISFSGMHVESINELFIKWVRSGLPPLNGEFEALKLQKFIPRNENRKAINEHLSRVS